MLMIINLIEPLKKLILNHLIGNNCPEFRNGLLVNYFFKLTLRSDCLELCFLGSHFQNHPRNTVDFFYKHLRILSRTRVA